MGQRHQVSRVVHLGVVLLSIGASACDAILGLGEEPNSGISTSTGATSSSTGVDATTGGGSGGDGGAGVASASSAGGSGGSDPVPPCGACDDDDDCRRDAADSAPAFCDEGVCVVRSVDVASDELAIGASRGLPLHGSHVAFISRVGDVFSVHVVDLERPVESVQSFGVDRGGAVVATDAGFAYLSLGGNQESTLTRFTCAPNCARGAKQRISSDGTPSYAGLEWLGDARFITVRNDGSGEIVILDATGGDVQEECIVEDANRDGFGPLKFVRDGEVVVWSRSTGDGAPEAGEAIEKLQSTDCDAESQGLFPTADRPSTTGIAVRGDSIAYTGVENSGKRPLEFHAWVGAISTGRAMKMTGPDGEPVTGAPVPGLALRSDGELLVPGKPGALMWSCRPIPGGYRCRHFELPGPIPDGLFDVFEVAVDEGRIVTLSGVDGGSRVTCIDASSRDGT